MYIHFQTSIRNRVSHDQFIWNSVMASSTPFPPFPVILSIPLLSVPCNIHSNLPVICGHTYIIKIPCTVCSRLSLSRIRNHSCGTDKEFTCWYIMCTLFHCYFTKRSLHVDQYDVEWFFWLAFTSPIHTLTSRCKMWKDTVLLAWILAFEPTCNRYIDHIITSTKGVYVMYIT